MFRPQIPHTLVASHFHSLGAPDLEEVWQDFAEFPLNASPAFDRAGGGSDGVLFKASGAQALVSIAKFAIGD